MFSWAEFKITIARQLPDMKHVSLYNWFDKLTNSTYTEGYELCSLTPPAEPPCHLQKTTFERYRWTLLYIRANQRHLGVQIQPIFSRSRSSERVLHHIGLAKYETAIEEGELVPGGFEGCWTKTKTRSTRLTNR